MGVGPPEANSDSSVPSKHLSAEHQRTVEDAAFFHLPEYMNAEYQGYIQYAALAKY